MDVIQISPAPTWLVKNYGKGKTHWHNMNKFFLFLYIFFVSTHPIIPLRIKCTHITTHLLPPPPPPPPVLMHILSFFFLQYINHYKKYLIVELFHGTLVVLLSWLRIYQYTIRSGDDRRWVCWARGPRLHLSVCSGGRQWHKTHHSLPSIYNKFFAWVWVLHCCESVSLGTAVVTSQPDTHCDGVHCAPASHEIKLK